MKKRLIISVFFLILEYLLLSAPKTVLAYQTVGTDCSWTVTDEFGNTIDNKLQKSATVFTTTNVNFKINVPSKNSEHTIDTSCVSCTWYGYNKKINSVDGVIDVSFPFSSTLSNSNITVNVIDKSYDAINPICKLAIQPSDWKTAPSPTPAKSAECELSLDPSTNIKNTTPLIVKGQVKNVQGFDSSSLQIIIRDYESGQTLQPIVVSKENIPVSYPLSSVSGLNFGTDIGKKTNGSYTVNANLIISDKNYNSYIPDSWTWSKCQLSFDVCDSGCGANVTPTPTITPTPPEWCNRCLGDCGGDCILCPHCIGSPTPVPPLPSLAPLCDQVADPKSKDQAIRDLWTECDKCINREHGIWTAIGCLPTNFEGILKEAIFPIGIGFAGAVAFLYFLYGAFIVLTSAGNPEKIAQAKEIIISSLSGLLLIIFSVFLLRVIGFDILKIPGFG